MFLPLKNLLVSSINRARISPDMEATFAMDHFKNESLAIWGDAAAKNIKPMYIKNQCLHVAVAGNLYAQEIRLRERRLVLAINEKMGKEVVSRIRCLI